MTGVTPNPPRDIGYLAEDAQREIASTAAPLQEGVIDAGSFAVTQASGGAGMILDVASNVGGGAFVDDDGLSPARIARYYVPPTAAKTTVTVATAHATLPRVDAVVVSMAGVVSIITGTATSGATIDNARDGSHGGAAIPSDALHLADVHVPAIDTTIANAQIRDRRKWARGAHFSGVRTAGSVTPSGSVFGLLDSALTPRIECSGAPVRMRVSGTWRVLSGSFLYVSAVVDGVGVNGMPSVGDATVAGQTEQTTGSTILNFEMTFTPSAGSHVLGFAVAQASGSTSFIYGSSDKPLFVSIEEDLRPSAQNNATSA
ncbi:hypothetical protein OJ997_27715 [Solirubrobacter phytolaccae]|uniref:Uncharacterized protein n=1 Tax=Solirubrobacter phytolaccae TaxID=1404360 RepID=A0A9X3SAW7_9ACTN|nr:hypothetical protein [Solirubrobacter phytolaccae]MDA0184128.1 hypothetical protein [Solirubrobacter phytolaccae]